MNLHRNVIGIPGLLVLLLSTCISGYSQDGDLDSGDKIIFRNERSAGFTLQSNGLGFDYRYGKFVSVKRKNLIEGSFNYFGSSKEIKSISGFQESKPFVYGKQNTVFNFRLQSGIQYELFEKFDKGGIAIRLIITGGGSLALLKPILYEVTDTYEDRIEDFATYYENSTTNHSGATIIRKSAFIEGIEETSVIPGLNMTIGFNFDYSTSDELYNAFEVGMTIDAYMKGVSIMYSPDDNSPQLFFTLFLSYRMGRILDAYK